MKDAIGYLRVSTGEQGRSGLGLAAQRHDIEAFGAREGFSINSWYQDIQTGAGMDALLLRPGLAAALKDARVARAPLIISRLDQLSRAYFAQGRPSIHGMPVHGFTPCRSGVAPLIVDSETASCLSA